MVAARGCDQPGGWPRFAQRSIEGTAWLERTSELQHLQFEIELIVAQLLDAAVRHAPERVRRTCRLMRAAAASMSASWTMSAALSERG